MATRTISTRIVLEGEKEYRSQMKALNSEMKTLKSELKAVDSEMKANGKSAESLAQKEKTLTDAINKQKQIIDTEKTALKQAQDAQQKFADAAEQARQKLDRLQNETDENTRETEEYKRAVEQAQAEVNKYQNAEQKAAQAVQQHTQKVNEGEAQLHKYEGQLKQTSNEASEFSKHIHSAFDAMTSPGAVIGVTVAAIKKLADAMVECVNSAMKWESAFTGVKKTIDATGPEYLQLANDIRQMATELPYAADEIAHIAEVSGQLGVSADDVLKFSKTMLELGVTTNMSAEEAATALARFVNVTGGSVDEVDRLASVIVDLGNNFATTESEIVDMASNVAAAGTQIGLTEPEILAVSAAMSSLGLEAASGGSSLSRLFTDIQLAVETANPKLEEFAQIAGTTSEEFQTMFRSDTAGAISKFFGGLTSGGESAIKVLDDLGVKNVRQRDTMLRLGNAVEMLTEAFDTANTAYDENIALVAEATKRYDTLESRLQVSKNKLEETKIEIGEGLTPAVIGLDSAWNEMYPTLLKAIPQFNILQQAGEMYVETAVKEAEANDANLQIQGKLNAERARAAREAEANANAVDRAAEQVQTRMSLLNEAFKEAFDTAYDGISKTVTGFEELDGSADRSTDDLIKSLKSQQKFMTDYAENMKQAVEWGVDKGLLETLSDGSVESAKIIASIVQSGKEGVDQLNEEWRKTEGMKVTTANVMAGIETEIESKTAGIVGDVGNLIRQMNAEFNKLSTYEAMKQVAALQQSLNNLDTKKLEGIGGFGNSHAAGLDYVPYDNYAANLHKGEMVLTALQAKAYRAEQSMDNITNNSVTIGDINITMTGDAATGKAAGKTIMQELQTQLRQRGVRF